MYSIFEINGGLGKCVMATAVIRGIMRKYPDRKLVVVSGYPDVFSTNPQVYRSLALGTPYIYEDYVRGQDAIFLCDEPYKSHEFFEQKTHLTKVWCNLIEVPHDGNDPSILLTPAEIATMKGNIKTNKPILIFQPFGGGEIQKNKYSWNRDIPLGQAQQLANFLCKTYHVVQPVHKNQSKLVNCQHLTVPLRELFVLIGISDRIIGIDSSVQHIAKAVGKRATVCWITNSPKVFGYDSHKNVFPSKSSYLDFLPAVRGGGTLEYDFTGSRTQEYPFKTEDIFDLNEILEE